MQQVDSYFKSENIRYQRKKPNETDEERQLRLANNRQVVNYRKRKSKLSNLASGAMKQHLNIGSNMKLLKNVRLPLQIVGSVQKTSLN